MLEPSVDRMLPAGWRPSVPFRVVVRYWERGRSPDVLWTMPFAVDDRGRVVHYLAVGPAGRPAASHQVAHIDFRGLPRGARVQVRTEQSVDGSMVYAVPNHTMN